MSEPAPTPRPVKLINFAEGFHNFEVPKVGPDGKPLRGPAQVSGGRKIPGPPLVEYFPLGSASNRTEGGRSPELSLTEGEWKRLIEDPGTGPVIRELVRARDVMLVGAEL